MTERDIEPAAASLTITEALAIAEAAIDWNNERLRIDRTTYTPEGASSARTDTDQRLMLIIQNIAATIIERYREDGWTTQPRTN